MKKILSFFIAVSMLAVSFAATGINAPLKKATDLYLTIGKNGEQISLMDLSRISVKDYQTISGRHMKFFEKMSFKFSQKKLAKSINADGSLNNKRLAKMLAEGDMSTGFHIGGFALGFFLGLIGVLIAYVANNNDNKRNRVKWAWIGFGIILVLNLIILALIL